MEGFGQLQALLQNLMRKGHDSLEADVTPEAPKSSAQKLVKQVQSSPSIVLPFQAYVYTFHATENDSWSCDVANLLEVRDASQIYRFAELVELRAVVRATHEAMDHPFTVEALWTTQEMVAADKDFARSVGSQLFVVGGMHSSGVHPFLEASLKQLNPAVKASVTFKDTPRFCMRVRPNRDALAEYAESKKKITHAQLLICGKLRVSSPGFAHCNFAESEEYGVHKSDDAKKE